MAQRLTDAGVEAREAVLYEQKLEKFSLSTKEALSQDRPTIAPVFSPRTARQLTRESDGLGAMRFAAISQAVADELSSRVESEIQIADAPGRKEMVRLVEEMVIKATMPEQLGRQL